MTACDANERGRNMQRLKLARLTALEERVDLEAWSEHGMRSLDQLSTEARSGLDGARVIDVLRRGEMPHLIVIKEHGKRLEHHGETARDRMTGAFLYQATIATMVADCYAGGSLGLPIHGYTSGRTRHVARGYRITGRSRTAVIAMLADMMEDRATPPALSSILKRAYRNLTDPPAERKRRQREPIP